MATAVKKCRRLRRSKVRMLTPVITPETLLERARNQPIHMPVTTGSLGYQKIRKRRIRLLRTT
jgi:hypothetical protein